MTRLVLLFLCAVGCLADLQCNDNEIEDSCPQDCAADFCPTSEAEALQGCPPAPNPCPPAACKCRFNSRRAGPNNNTCIDTRQCPPFECNRPFEEFNPCPPLCPSDSCSQATPDGRCPRLFGRIGIVLICSPKCRCIKNYWRLDGVCVPYAECPQNIAPAATPSAETPVPNKPAAEPSAEPPVPETPSANPPETSVADPQPASDPADTTAEKSPEDDIIEKTTKTAEYSSSHSSTSANASKSTKSESSEECDSSEEDEICSGPNEEYILEKPSCPGEFCYTITARINCTGAPPPQPGCACKSGYFRLEEASPCIGICECPQMAYSLQCLGISN